MELQKQFVAANAHRIADKAAVASVARQAYSKQHAKRVLAELATADNARAIALIFNAATWANAKGMAVDADLMFVDENDLAAAAGVVTIPEFYAAPQGASRRQMARLWANFQAMKIAPADALALCVELDGREWLQAAQSWADTNRGFVGRCVGWSDAQLRANGIARPVNPIDLEAGDRHPRDEYAIATPTLEAVEPWLHRPCANCGDLTANGSICEPCETMFADEAEARAERELEFRAA